MNGIEKITQRIADDARMEIDDKLKAAEKQVSSIKKRFEDQIHAEEKELAAKNYRIASERLSRLENLAHMESRKLLLAAKQKEIDKVYELALRKLCSMPRDKYVEVLADFMEKTGAIEGELFFAAEDLDVGRRAVAMANDRLGSSLSVSREPADIRGGFVLRSGKTEINCAFETLVRLSRAQTAGKIAEMMF